MSVDKYISNKSIAELFPSLVWVYDLSPETSAKANKEILGLLDKIASPRPRPTNDLSLQTRTDLHKTPAFKTLGLAFDASVKDVLTSLHIKNKQYLITGTWANISEPGIRHHRHAHPNNYLSSVYYVSVPKGGDTIRFHDPRPQTHTLQPLQDKTTRYDAHSMTINVVPGRLVIFHSWLEHSVDANDGDGERISVAMNVMFKRFGELHGSPMWEPKIKPNEGND